MGYYCIISYGTYLFNLLMKKILTYTFLFLMVLTSSSWSASCDGFDSETGSWVWGDCSGGSFDGYDSQTSAYVWGDCQPGGSLDAWNSETGAWVWGDCDS